MSSDHVSLREFIEAKLDPLTEKAEEIIALQRETNGRVRKAEAAIAVLTWAYGLGALVIGWLVVMQVSK